MSALRYRVDHRTPAYVLRGIDRWVYGVTTDLVGALVEMIAHKAEGRLVRLTSLEATAMSPIERTLISEDPS